MACLSRFDVPAYAPYEITQVSPSPILMTENGSLFFSALMTGFNTLIPKGCGMTLSPDFR